MTIDFSTLAQVNTGLLAGVQTGPKVASTADGGHIVAWTDFASPLGLVRFQRYDGSNQPVGTAITAFAGANGTLRDVMITQDGRLAIAASTPFGTGVVSFFDPLTGLLQSIVNVPSTVSLSNVQLLQDPTVPGNVIVISGGFNVSTLLHDLQRSIINVSGLVSNSGVYFSSPVALVEVIEGQLALLTDGRFISPDPLFTQFQGASGDVIRLQNGFYVATAPLAGNHELGLTALYGEGVAFNQLQFVAPFQATSTGGSGSATARTAASQLIDLGGGRILLIWVSDSGDTIASGQARDGVYASVFNMATGASEGTATLVRDLGIGANDAAINAVRLEASLLADGRVALAISTQGTLSLDDVYQTILDARVAGVTLTATAGVDKFVGSAFNDTFTGLQNGDIVNGGAGSDTVVFTDTAAHNIDLGQPQNFPTTTLVLTDIENLTGNSGADDLRGTSEANILLGGAGNDALQGRSGNDTMSGGTLDDLLRGDAGEDLLKGDDGNDSILGGADNDLIHGGIGDDRIRGDLGDDTVNADAGNDRLNGGAGADVLTGSDGEDTLDGDAGDDVLYGGSGHDTLRGDEGSDELYAGSGNDMLRALTEAQFVDGGVGIDTLTIADRVFVPGNGGAHVDLTGDFDLLGLENDYIRFGGTITAVENIIGTSGDDFIAGDATANILRGGKGDDIFLARAGNDTLFGNAGADGFIFTAPTSGTDRLADFEMAFDKIWLGRGGFGDISEGNIAARLTVNATGTVGANGLAQLIFDNAGAGYGTLFFDADGNGAGAAVILAVLVPTTNDLVALTATNFAFL